MKKLALLLFCGMAMLPACFSQNMLIIGGEYNPLTPLFWDGNMGFNIKTNEYMQNEMLLGAGVISSRDENGEDPEKMLFAFRDNFFFSLEGRYLGLRAGVSGALGVFDVLAMPGKISVFVNLTGLVGLWILPRSLISVVVDICPGYGLTFFIPDGFISNSRFVLPIALSLRLNIDKL
jgi:hypothetical protein